MIPQKIAFASVDFLKKKVYNQNEVIKLKVAVIGSRGISVDNLKNYMPQGISEIVSGGARGVDNCAAKYAKQHNIKITEFLPNYEIFGKGAPIKRNEQIVDYADMVVALWDGVSRGTKSVIDMCAKKGKRCDVFIIGGK